MGQSSKFTQYIILGKYTHTYTRNERSGSIYYLAHKGRKFENRKYSIIVNKSRTLISNHNITFGIFVVIYNLYCKYSFSSSVIPPSRNQMI